MKKALFAAIVVLALLPGTFGLTDETSNVGVSGAGEVKANFAAGVTPAIFPIARIAFRVLVRHGKRVVVDPVRNSVQTAKRWLEKFKIGPVAPSTPLRNKYMEQLYKKQKGMDALCKVPLPPLYVGPLRKRRLNPDIEIDHKIPKAKGGDDRVSNLQLTHRQYNRSKGDLTGHELRRTLRRVCPA